MAYDCRYFGSASTTSWTVLLETAPRESVNVKNQAVVSAGGASALITSEEIVAGVDCHSR